MISCEEAATICTKSQYKEAGLGERTQLWLHLLVCKACASFSRKNRELTRACEQAALKALTPQEKAVMKERLKRSR